MWLQTLQNCGAQTVYHERRTRWAIRHTPTVMRQSDVYPAVPMSTRQRVWIHRKFQPQLLAVMESRHFFLRQRHWPRQRGLDDRKSGSVTTRPPSHTELVKGRK